MAIISVLVGTARPQRQGIKLANYIAKKLESRGHKVHMIDPLEHKSLLSFDERYRYHPNPSEDLTKVQQKLDESEAFFAITPEVCVCAVFAFLLWLSSLVQLFVLCSNKDNI